MSDLFIDCGIKECFLKIMLMAIIYAVLGERNRIWDFYTYTNQLLIVTSNTQH